MSETARTPNSVTTGGRGLGTKDQGRTEDASSLVLRTPYLAWRRQGKRFLLVMVLLTLTGSAGYLGYQYFRAEHCLRAAEKARQQRDFLQARRYLEVCLELRPNSAEAHFLLARIARQAGFYLEAEQRLDICQRLKGSTDAIRLERSLLQVQQGAFSALAEVQLQEYLNQDHPDSEHILEALSRGCLRTFRLNNARTYLDFWLERHPDNVQALLWRGWAHERMYYFANAKDDYRQAVSIAPDNQDAQMHLAQLLLLSGEIKEAEELFRRLRPQQPDNPLIAMGLAQCQGRLGRTEEALRSLDDLAARFPEEAPVLLERGRVALQSGQASEAEVWLRRALAQAPADYQTNYTLFLCLKQLGREDQAKQQQERVRRIQADLLHLQELSEEVQQHPYDLGRRCEIASVFLRNGQESEGVQWLKNVLKIEPQHPQASQLLADYYERNGQPALAAQYR